MGNETLKLPPQNIEAEQSVLGAMLLDEEAVIRVLEFLGSDQFYKESHHKIFSAMTDLFQKSRAVDLVTLTEELKKNDSLEAVGGAHYLTSLTDVVATTSHVEYHARIVKEKALLRNLINSSTKIIAECYKSDIDADQALDEAEQMIFEIASGKVEGKAVSIKGLIPNTIEKIEQMFHRKEHVTGVPTGFHEIDVMTAGLQPSDLIIVAARPSMGKSAFVSCITENAAIHHKVPTAIFSLEMSTEQLVQRMLCSHARVDLSKVRTGYLEQRHFSDLAAAGGVLSEAPIFIDDTAGLSVLELRAKARRLKAQHNIGLITVDYLQLMQGRSSIDNRQQEISEISRSLKALARELDVPVIAVSQLSRAVENREGNKPRLSDLRESGALEQDADLVIMLYRSDYYSEDKASAQEGIVEVNIAKQRNGPVGTKNLTFLKEFTRFENYSAREELAIPDF
ncbi:MAG: replicative DNA helicase [Candidatus Omnitrophica bacterium]|nr:replicative DNA helicase [Candidatus Omnitrophota bacterium]